MASAGTKVSLVLKTKLNIAATAGVFGEVMFGEFGDGKVMFGKVMFGKVGFSKMVGTVE